MACFHPETAWKLAVNGFWPWSLQWNWPYNPRATVSLTDLGGSAEREPVGQERLGGEHLLDALDMDFGVGREFEEPLATTAAGGAAFDTKFGFGIDARDGDGANVPCALGDGSGEGGSFGAKAQPVTRVLHVAASDHCVAFRQHGGPDPELGIGGMGIEGSRGGSAQECLPINGRFWCVHAWEGNMRKG